MTRLRAGCVGKILSEIYDCMVRCVHMLSLDKLHGNVTIFRLLSTCIARRSSLLWQWKSVESVQLLHDCKSCRGRRCCPWLPYVVSLCLTCCMICCPACTCSSDGSDGDVCGGALAIYDSPRGVCAIYEYFRKSNVSPPLAPLTFLFTYNYMAQRELRIQYCCQSAMGTKPAASLDEVSQAALHLTSSPSSCCRD